MAFPEEAVTTSDLSFIASAHLKAILRVDVVFVNYQVDVPTGYFTIEENTDIYSFSK